MPQPYQISSDLVDPESERLLLSAIYSSPETYFNIVEHLDEDAFSVFKEEFLGVAHAIEDERELPPVQDLPQPPGDPMALATRLQELLQKRLLADYAQIFLMELRDESTPAQLSSILEKGIAAANQVLDRTKKSPLVSANSLLPEIIQQLNERYQRAQISENGLAGISSGFKKLDELTGGLSEALFFIAAPPGFGKTTFATNIALNVAKGGNPVLFCSYEEPIQRLAGKGIASLSSLEFKRFEDGLADPSSMEEAASFHHHVLKNLFFLEGTSKTSIEDISQVVRLIKRETGKDHIVVVIDYFQKAASNHSGSGEFRHTLEAFLKDVFELLIKKEKASVLMLSAQNRSGQGSGSISSMRDGGDYDGDIIGVFTESDRHVINPCRALDLVIGKNRRGGTGVVQLTFDPALGQFSEVEE